jgi:hypothetical protein
MRADRRDSPVVELAEACAKGYGAACMELERRAEAYGIAREAMRDLMAVYMADGELDVHMDRVAAALGLGQQEGS